MRLSSSMHPTQSQKTVIAVISSAETPALADSMLSGSSNLIAAKRTLVSLGLVSGDVDQDAGLTSLGQQIARDEGIVDDGGQLTPDGQQLLTALQPSGSDDPADMSDPTLPQTEAYEPMSTLRSLLES